MRGGFIINSVILRINDDENNLIRNYANKNNITISELMSQTVLEKIEDEIDLELYNQEMKEHKENPRYISFDEMITELAFRASRASHLT